MACCEMCGRETRGCRPGLVDGVKMMLCPDCMRHGTAVQQAPPIPRREHPAAAPARRPPSRKDIFKNMTKELVANWSQVIKEARVKKGLSREELGFRIGERTVIISKLENGDLRPSDKMITKLEKELGITLTELVSEVQTPTSGISPGGMSLGDFIKTEEK